ncbi:MAG: hypothetical protein ACPGWM_00485 [Flavobacteriales bacterium]
MKLSIKFLGFATILFFATSCYQWVPYSTQIQEQYHLSVRDLQGIQFYLSHPIKLYKATSEDAATSTDGKLLIDPNRKGEHITLKAGTKGVFLNGSAFKMAVSFEVGEGRYLIFGSTTKEGPFKLQAQSWENKHGLLQYAGQDYFAEPGSGKAQLLIKMKKLREVERKGRLVKGRTVQ